MIGGAEERWRVVGGEGGKGWRDTGTREGVIGGAVRPEEGVVEGAREGATGGAREGSWYEDEGSKCRVCSLCDERRRMALYGREGEVFAFVDVVATEREGVYLNLALQRGGGGGGGELYVIF